MNPKITKAELWEMYERKRDEAHQGKITIHALRQQLTKLREANDATIHLLRTERDLARGRAQALGEVLVNAMDALGEAATA